jgi:hypothetical protein
LTDHKKVIQFPSQAPSRVWSFFDFGYLPSGIPIEDWYEKEISDRARFSFNALIKNNEKIANHQEWSGVDKQMQGELKGEQIWQWRISGELAYRILGAFWGAKRAVFLMGYHHKGGNYTPPNALRTALERKKLLDQGACKLYERQAEDNL